VFQLRPGLRNDALVGCIADYYFSERSAQYPALTIEKLRFLFQASNVLPITSTTHHKQRHSAKPKIFLVASGVVTTKAVFVLAAMHHVATSLKLTLVLVEQRASLKHSTSASIRSIDSSAGSKKSILRPR